MIKQAARTKLVLPILMFLAALLPSSARASEANIVLQFSDADKWYLFASFGFGIIAIIFAIALAKSIKAMSPGNEKMQEVGKAIRDGALGYLRQQVKTMSYFVIALAVVLAVVFGKQYGAPMKGIWTALSFVLGVAASYIAGYAGMLLAVEGNMRTAHAALTSYAQSLKVAFRSGAVAGLITVGMGLIGATAILYFGKDDSMKYLIGFGFGGSLAALFMRVGGGIFTKAADVGADLVGKVEAGIPEDDPRNPAVIADNVGDNVGDCAGMAADIFESYEVTLVAAIVLGAATSAIFDQPTWMKLVLFALMARGIGIIASIIGIYSVKGSDDIDADPLKAIRRGFNVSALVAVLGTLALAYFTMGGNGQSLITTTQFVSQDQSGREETEAIRAIASKVGQEKGLRTDEIWKVSADDVKKHGDFVALKIDEVTASQKISQALQPPVENQPKPSTYSGYSPIDFSSTNPILDYTVMSTPSSQGEQPKPKTFKEEYSVDGLGKQLKPFLVFKLKITPKPSTGADPKSLEPRELFYGPAVEAGDAGLDKQIESAKTFATVEKLQKFNVNLYVNPEGKAVWGVDSVNDKGDKLEKIQNLSGGASLFYYRVSVKEFEANQEAQKKAQEDAQKNPTATPAAVPQPPTTQVPTALAVHKVVPWYMFFIAITFGVIMAFAIEKLTDYYVSLNGKPVNEVAGVATAGPAPMIISGFALGQESSVFSVFAIVVALIVPVQLFPAAEYGGYILSFYGVALVGLGLLTTTGFILAMDTFGPISDNAQGVFEMSGAGHDNPEGAKRVQRLDAAGNTTKALTKGFAIATAVVAAVALFHSYLESAQLTGIGLPLDIPEIFLGLMIGGAAPYLFSAFSINAVGRAAFELINEVRSQFRNDPGIMAGSSKPNYEKCVAIVTAAAQRELLGPGILAIALPMAVAFGFSIGKAPVQIGDSFYNLTGAQALGGFLAGAILSGQLMAVLLANSGGIWDNAKKLIEDGMHGGKGTEAHKAGVVCDTVGDPFKDTAGPALNPLIKVMNLIALLMVPVIIQPYGTGVLVTITLVCVAALAFSTWWSKRSSMSTAMTVATAGGGGDALPPSSPKTSKKRITVEDETVVETPEDK
jgi:K(+)-stimulated pyrophosphate-energized sodium pump